MGKQCCMPPSAPQRRRRAVAVPHNSSRVCRQCFAAAHVFWPKPAHQRKNRFPAELTRTSIDLREDSGLCTAHSRPLIQVCFYGRTLQAQQHP